MHLLDTHGDYWAVELDASLDQPGKVPLRPARAARGKTAAVQEDDDGQGLRPRAPGIERRRRHVEGQALSVAEGVVWVRKAVLQQKVLIVDVLGVSDRQGASLMSAQGVCVPEGMSVQ